MGSAPPFIDIFAAVAEASVNRQLPLLVIGGHAVNGYGYSRTTVDVDFLIAADDLPAWRKALEDMGWRWSGQTETFAKFLPPETEPPSLPVDLMLVTRTTFAKLQVEKHELKFGATRLPAPQPLFLIALKLHAMKNEHRRALGRDLPDILQIIRLGNIDTNGVDFQQIVARYADEPTRNLLNQSLQAH